MEPLVSVIVPAHNAAPWLERCLGSLLGQTLERLEVIVVDDASTDATAAIADAWAARWPERVRLLRLERNRGAGAARNAGLAVAAGRYAGFADVDDTQEPAMYAALVAAAESAGAQVTVCGLRKVFADGAPDEVHLPAPGMSPAALLAHDELMPPVWNKLFLRSFLESADIRFPDTRVSEDMAFVFKALASAGTVACVPEAFYNYHRHGESVCLNMAQRADSIASLADARAWLAQRGLFERHHRVWRRLAWLHLAYYPACLLFIDALLKGHGRWQTLRDTPGYCRAVAAFLRGETRGHAG